MTTDDNGPGGESGAVRDEALGGGYVTATIPRHPVAHASVYAPFGRRTWWWWAIRCPHCGHGHFGRVRDRESIPCVRRASCGRLVWLIAARTYEPTGTQ